MNVLPVPSAERLADELVARFPAFAPAVHPAPGGSGDALVRVYGAFLHALAERIAAAPDKNELAFLDQLGLDLLPAQAARAPVVFTTIPGGGNGRAPAGTRLAAQMDAQPVFETERTVGLQQARIAEVVSLWPGRDAYADHSADAIGGRPFTLWDGLQPVAHELYLAHDLHFALAGVSSVGLQFEVAPGGSEALELEWSWWDGAAWRAFKDFRDDDESGWSFDATGGLTRSGTIRVATDCGASVQRVVGGWNAHWLRARTTKPLPPDPSRTLAAVDRISLRTIVDVSVGSDCSGGLLPDAAFGGGTQLDLTKQAYPFGQGAAHDDAFYVACEAAFSRPGAAVTLCVARGTSPQDEADAKLAPYEVAIDKAQEIVQGLIDDATALAGALDWLVAPGGPLYLDPNNPDAPFDHAELQDLLSKTKDAVSKLADATLHGSYAAGGAGIGAGQVSNVPLGIPVVDAAVLIAAFEGIKTLQDVTDALQDLSTVAEPAIVTAVGDLATELNKDIGQAVTDFQNQNWAGLIGDIIGASLLPNQVTLTAKSWAVWQMQVWASSGDIWNSTDLFQKVETLFKQAHDAIAGTGDSGAAHSLIDELSDLSPITLAAAAGVLPPELDAPALAWEYWNGSAWVDAGVTSATAAALNLMASGSLAFTVPRDWEQSDVQGTKARWLRARLASGSYARVRLVSWKDQETKEIRYMPVIEPRPPLLDAFRIGYHWESKPSAPQHTLTLNDFAWADSTADATWRGSTFVPFAPCADTTPGLYLGFDGPLPPDELGFLVDVAEVIGDDAGPALVWERWDGASWSAVAVEDETSGLAVPGIVHVPYSGDEWPAPARLTAAAAQTVTLADSRAAAGFAAGDKVWIASGEKGELAVVAGSSEAVVTTAAPLAGTYTNGTLARAALPRFGTPRSWIRARLRAGGEPRKSVVQGIYANAAWAAQTDTVNGEILGSSTGEPSQSFFCTRTPVLVGEVIDVRELEGERAHVEYPLLLAELAAAGIRESDLVVERDPQSGHETAVWVPWRRRPNLDFSGPTDRDYTIERTRGRVLFGDGVHGRVPPVFRDGIRARTYRSGGGVNGNVPAGAITQVLSGVLVASVTNPRPAEGGADSETDAQVLSRGPLTVRNRRQAITLGDYEALAFEASPAVAVARATARRGTITVTVVPFGPEPQPTASWELRAQVRAFLAARAPAAAGSLAVLPPVYFEVGVSTTVVPTVVDDGGIVVAAVRDALARFLHPLTGGPAGAGWPFGRGVYASDVAALLAGVHGVDHVAALVLSVAGAPQGDVVAVPADRLVAAGFLDVELEGLG